MSQGSNKLSLMIWLLPIFFFLLLKRKIVVKMSQISREIRWKLLADATRQFIDIDLNFLSNYKSLPLKRNFFLLLWLESNKAKKRRQEEKWKCINRTLFYPNNNIELSFINGEKWRRKTSSFSSLRWGGGGRVMEKHVERLMRSQEVQSFMLL